jgi:streptogramin lyase
MRTHSPSKRSTGLRRLPGPAANSSVWHDRAATDVVTEFPVPTANSGVGPGSLTVGPDGNLWFTESLAPKIARITPTGAVTEFPVTRTLPLDSLEGPTACG